MDMAAIDLERLVVRRSDCYRKVLCGVPRRFCQERNLGRSSTVIDALHEERAKPHYIAKQSISRSRQHSLILCQLPVYGNFNFMPPASASRRTTFRCQESKQRVPSSA